MSGDLSQRQTAIEGVVRPLAESLGKLETQVREIETARSRMFGGLQQQLQALAHETGTLSSALKAPQARGRWGEITLHRVAELAGMVPYCDFYEQETHEANSGRIRPDMSIRLPGDRWLAVDAKAPLSAYLDAVAATDEITRRACLRRHTEQLLRHVDDLSGRQYWAQLQPAPELVVLFLPGDHFLSAALEANPALMEQALERKVLIATPMTLIAVLKGIAYGWRQEQLAENAEQIRQVAAEFYERFQTYAGYYADMGRHLERAIDAYNHSVGSWESRLMPSLRRMRELGAASAEEPVAPEQIDVAPRAPRAPLPDDATRPPRS